MENEKKEKIFVNGLIFKRPNEQAPDFVKGHISINLASFKEFLKQHESGEWLNIDMLNSKENKIYFVLNTWKHKERFVKKEDGKIGVEEVEEEINVDGIPF